MNEIENKLSCRGAKALTEEELLTLLMGDEAMARALKEEYHGSLKELCNKDLSRLRMIGGMGLRRAGTLIAGLELGRRIALEKAGEQDIIADTRDVVRIFRPKLAHLLHEECWVLFLTSSNRVIEPMRVSQGGLQATVVDHRLIIKRALELLAAQIILIHNHPSGAALASRQDKVMTDRVKAAAALFDITILDHVIISREGEFSFRGEGLL